MRILLLGAGGFVGSHLVDHLVERGEHEVIGLDVAAEKLADVDASRYEFHHFDIQQGDPHYLDRLIGDADVVVDLIAYANPSLYVSSPLEVFELNFMQNLDVAKRCIRHGKRLIQYSSAEVYGKSDGGDLCREYGSDSIFGPMDKSRWIYATGKLLLERVLHAYGEAGQLEYTIVRPFNFVGSRIDYLVPANAIGGPRVFPHFMSALLSGGPMRLVNGGNVHRAFLHIDDANAAFQVLLDRPDDVRNQVFNVGNPDNNITIRDLARLMCELYEEFCGEPAPSRIEDIDGEQFYGAGYEDGDRLPPDISRLRSLGWAPRYDLRSTIADTMRGYLAPRLDLGTVHAPVHPPVPAGAAPRAELV